MHRMGTRGARFCSDTQQTQVFLESLLTQIRRSFTVARQTNTFQLSREWSERLSEALELHEKEKERLSQTLTKTEAVVRTLQQQREELRQTLVGYKRESLVQFKVQSGAVQQELALLEQQRAELISTREQLAKEVG